MKETNLVGNHLVNEWKFGSFTQTPINQCLCGMMAPILGVGGLRLHLALSDFSGD